MAGPRLVALFIILLGTAFSLSRFVGVDGPARHVDSAWLYTASVCLWEGHSPYNMSHFAACWEATQLRDYTAPFVFGPSLLALAWPLALVDLETAYLLIHATYTLAIVAMAAAFWRIAEIEAATGLRQILGAVWLAFGVSMGGAAGAAFTGQPVGLVALGLALAYLAFRARNNSWFAVGTLLCLIKPHLVLLPLALLWFRHPTRVLLGKAGVVILWVLGLAILTLFDGDLFTDYWQGLQAHRDSTTSKLGEVSILYGVPGVFDRHGLAMGLLLAVGLAALALAAGFLRAGRAWHSDDAVADALLLAALFAGIAIVPVKGYDLAVLAPAYALIARASLSVQAVCAVPMLILWRPNLLALAGIGPETALTGVTLLLVALAAYFLSIALAERRASP